MRCTNVEVGVIAEEEGPFGCINFWSVGGWFDHMAGGGVGWLGSSILCLSLLC